MDKYIIYLRDPLYPTNYDPIYRIYCDSYEIANNMFIKIEAEEYNYLIPLNSVLCIKEEKGV